MRPRAIPLGTCNLIGETVTRLRKKHKMSQKTLAANMQLLGIDINYSSLSKLEGQTRIATDKEMLALATIFQVSIEELFSRDES